MTQKKGQSSGCWLEHKTQNTTQPLVRQLYLFFQVVIFSGGSKNIAGQTTVPFWGGLKNFLVCNWCSNFETSTNYVTYIRPEIISTRKKRYSCLAGHVFWQGSNYNRKNCDPKKKVQSSGRQLKCISDNRLSCQNRNTNYYKTGKKYDPKKKGAVVWSSVGAQNIKHNTHRHNNK
jgi:hypothetical protein